MSDAIANISGTDLFASHRSPAWHGKGNVFTEEILSISAAMDMVPDLRDREVRLESIYLPGDVIGLDTDGSEIVGQGQEVEGQFASVSYWPNGTRSQYGVVGSRYGIIQDAPAFEVFDGFRVETLGALYDGRKTFASFALDRETVLDPTGVADRVTVYGLGINSHDGTSPLTWATTPVRVVCQNTLNMAMGTLKNVEKVRHTKSGADRVKVHADLYRASLSYADEFDKFAKEMFEAKFSDTQYDNAFVSLFGKPAELEGAALTKYENKRGTYMAAWNGEPNAGIKGTAWGALNALTEANQWGRNMRQGARGQDAFVAAGMGLDGPTNKFRESAKSLVMARAGIK